MSTLRELAAESIGRITRRGLEPQIAQLDAALLPAERVIAMAPGKDGAAGLVVVVTDARLLVSSGAPFTKPDLASYSLPDVAGATASADGDTWSLRVDHPAGQATIPGMFDRDAQRLAALLRQATANDEPTP